MDFLGSHKKGVDSGLESSSFNSGALDVSCVVRELKPGKF